MVLTTSRCAAPCRTHLPACGHGAGLVAGVDVDVKGVALGLGINGADFVAPLTPEILSHLAAVAAVADAAADAAAQVFDVDSSWPGIGTSISISHLCVE